MSKIEVNTVEPQCGTTLTLGASGDTVDLSNALPKGIGTVNWDTTKKTAAFTAVSGEGYFIDTSSSAITMTLPASPSAGDIVAFKDYAGTFATNNLTIGRNSSNLDGNAGDRIIDTDNTSMSLVYVDATQGWKSVEEGTGFIGKTYIVATGGTITTCGDHKIHTFTGPGTFTVCSVGSTPACNVVDYLVVAGGGGASSGPNAGARESGGGGAGGFRLSNSLGLPAPTTSPLANPTGLPVSAQGYPITVGGGGAGSPQGCSAKASDGVNSVFSTITSAGGGASGVAFNPNSPGTRIDGNDGGSGGGGSQSPANSTGPGGTGNTPPVSPPQGNNGGTGQHVSGCWAAGGGGGGAGAAGANAAAPTPGLGRGGTGGVGSFVSPSFAVSCAGTPGPVGSTRYFAGGGGGGSMSAGTGTAGGSGGGGSGGTNPNTLGTDGTTNTGGGAGGTARDYTPGAGKSGGSGIVIIRYKFQ
jgi:hypothetical protein